MCCSKIVDAIFKEAGAVIFFWFLDCVHAITELSDAGSLLLELITGLPDVVKIEP